MGLQVTCQLGASTDDRWSRGPGLDPGLQEPEESTWVRLSTKAVVVRHTAPAGGPGPPAKYVRACGQRLAAQLQCPLRGPGSFCSEHGSGAWPAPLQGEGCAPRQGPQ